MGLNLDDYTAMVDSRAPDLGADAMQEADLPAIAELLRQCIAGMSDVLENSREAALVEVRSLISDKRIPANAIRNIFMDPYGIVTIEMNIPDAAAFGERILESAPVLGFYILQKKDKPFHTDAVDGLQNLLLHPRLRAFVLQADARGDTMSGSEFVKEVLSAVDAESKIAILGSSSYFGRHLFAENFTGNAAIKVMEAPSVAFGPDLRRALALLPNLQELRLETASDAQALIATDFAKTGVVRVRSRGNHAEMRKAFGKRFIGPSNWRSE
jgi:hypothetical protein